MLTSIPSNHSLEYEDEVDGSDGASGAYADADADVDEEHVVVSNPMTASKTTTSQAVIAPAAASRHPDLITSMQSEASKKWCRGGSVCSLLICLLCILIFSFLLAAHCTTLIGYMIDQKPYEIVMPNYLGVPHELAVIVGVLCSLGIGFALNIVRLITCSWRKIVREEVRKRYHHERHSRFILKLFWRYLSFFWSSQSPYYYLIVFALEIVELVSQAFAIERYSTTGMSRPFLAIYTLIVALNVVTPLVMTRLLHAQKKAPDPVYLNLWTRRLALFDCSCDLLTTFPLPYISNAL
eukprot:g1157.t1